MANIPPELEGDKPQQSENEDASQGSPLPSEDDEGDLRSGPLSSPPQNQGPQPDGSPPALDEATLIADQKGAAEKAQEQQNAAVDQQATLVATANNQAEQQKKPKVTLGNVPPPPGAPAIGTPAGKDEITARGQAEKPAPGQKGGTDQKNKSGEEGKQPESNDNTISQRFPL